jgi:hypothetical protein
MGLIEQSIAQASQKSGKHRDPNHSCTGSTSFEHPGRQEEGEGVEKPDHQAIGVEGIAKQAVPFRGLMEDGGVKK